jgi:hypothetical protein
MIRSLQLGLPRHRGNVEVIKQVPHRRAEIHENDPQVRSDSVPRLVMRCALNATVVAVTSVAPSGVDDDASDLASLVLKSRMMVPGVAIPLLSKEPTIKAMVIDVRRSASEGPFFLAALGQTIALEDFFTSPRSDMLVLSLRRSLEFFNWVAGTSEEHLLFTWPVGYSRLELSDVGRFHYGE